MASATTGLWQQAVGRTTATWVQFGTSLGVTCPLTWQFRLSLKLIINLSLWRSMRRAFGPSVQFLCPIFSAIRCRPITSDSELLRRYAENRSEAAFAELVNRPIALVYAVALRQVGGDARLAQDVTQRVFTDLAR